MGYTCTPQITGLVRGTPKPNAKHRASGRAICEEAGNERYSRSITLDRTRSVQNEYDGYKSGGKCWDAMEASAAEYKVSGRTKNGQDFVRGLRGDAVIGVACIFNPPAEMTVGWSDDDYARFYADSMAAMETIEPRIFRSENVRMRARHKDEGLMDDSGEYGQHEHVILDAKDADGKYCGNVIDAAMLVRVNQNYPRLMRERGWELDDLDTTDFSRMGKDADGNYKDPAYRAERRAKRRQTGRSVNRYIADKAKEAGELYQDASAAYAAAISEQQTAGAALDAARAEYAQASSELIERAGNMPVIGYELSESELVELLKRTIVKDDTGRVMSAHEAVERQIKYDAAVAKRLAERELQRQSESLEKKAAAALSAPAADVPAVPAQKEPEKPAQAPQAPPEAATTTPAVSGRRALEEKLRNSIRSSGSGQRTPGRIYGDGSAKTPGGRAMSPAMIEALEADEKAKTETANHSHDVDWI